MRLSNRPGKISEFFLRVMSSEIDQFGVLGDFEEIYREMAEREGVLQAKKWYWKQIIFSFPQFIRNKIYWGGIMLSNYIKVAFRTLKKHKGYSFINILGLAAGLTIGMLMILYVINELSYDKHIKNVENKYRAVTSLSFQGNEFKVGQTAAPAVVDLKNEIPEIKDYTRFYHDDGIFSYKNISFSEKDILYAEKNVFDFFSIEMRIGNPATALDVPNTVVLTEETAEKYFGDEEPMGKVLKLDDKNYFTVTGVCRANPTTTHFHFDFLVSFKTLEKSEYHKRFLNSWMGFNYISYVELNKPEDYKILSDKLPEYIHKKTDDIAKQFNAEIVVYFEPVTDIYLFTEVNEDDAAIKGNVTYIILFTAIGVFIIMIACINFMNLSTARSVNRLKEIGMRKVLGAGRKRIIAQFLGESMLFSAIAFILGLVMFYLLVPTFSGFVGKELEVFMLFSLPGIGGILLLFVLVGLISGSYPAIYISRNQTVNSLLGKSAKTGGAKIFRNFLVNFQFVTSIVLITITLVIYNQLEYMKSKDLGYNIEQVLVLPLSSETLQNSNQVIKSKVKQIPGVMGVSASSSVPGGGRNITGYKFEGIDLGEDAAIENIDVDKNFMNTMQMKLKAGRFFSDEYGSDDKSVIINSTLAKLLGWENPIGRTAEQMDMVDNKPVYLPYTIIGVMEDYHFTSLKERIKPHILFSKGEWDNLSVRINASSTDNVIESLKSICSDIDPNTPFNYYFLDESFYEQYQAEQRLGEIFIYFTILAIMISCLGLFGLTSFSAEQRRKEVGIRKTLGAGTGTIVYLLAKEFIRWVILANVIAVPIAYYAIQKWLENFAYKLDLDLMPFVLAGIITLFISLTTVAYQTTKAAMANPVDSIKYE